MRELAAAFGFLTILPVGRGVWSDVSDEAEADADEGRPDALMWYPTVGWFLGGVSIVLVWVIGLLGVSLVRNATLVAVVVLCVHVVLTRFLHWDGLADATDGLLGSFDRERRLEIMHDSRVGAFGATAIVFAALLQVTAVASLVSVGSWWPLVAAPVIGRASVTLAAWSLPPARPDGLGLTVASERVPFLRRAVAALSVLALALPLAAEALYPGSGWGVARVVVVLVVADVSAIAIPRLLARPVGGMTGDLYGATVVLVETAVLVAAAMAI